jgi:hypothetical protein
MSVMEFDSDIRFATEVARLERELARARAELERRLAARPEPWAQRVVSTVVRAIECGL